MTRGMNVTDDGVEVSEEVELVFADLRAALLAPPDEVTAARHLRAMGDAAPAAAVVGRPRRRVVAVAAGAAAAGIFLTGGLAAANTLPAPVQDAVASAAEVVGLDLPRSEDRDEPVVVDEAPSTTDSPATSDDRVARLKAHDAVENRRIACLELEFEKLRSLVGAKPSGTESRRAQRLGFRREGQAIGSLRVVERLDAERIAREDEALGARIVQRDGIHAAQLPGEIQSLAPV